MDAKADLSLRWAHSNFISFDMRWPISSLFFNEKSFLRSKQMFPVWNSEGSGNEGSKPKLSLSALNTKSELQWFFAYY